MTDTTAQMLIFMVLILPMVVSIVRAKGMPGKFPWWTVYLALTGAIVITGIGAVQGALTGNYWLLLPWVSIVALSITCFSLLRITLRAAADEGAEEEAQIIARSKKIRLHLRLMLTFGGIMAVSGLIIAVIIPMIGLISK